MVDTAIYLGANENNAKKELSEVLDFEIKLANTTAEKTFHIWQHPIRLWNLRTRNGFPTSWKYFIEKLFNDTVKIDGREYLIISDLNYFKKLGPLLRHDPFY